MIGAFPILFATKVDQFTLAFAIVLVSMPVVVSVRMSISAAAEQEHAGDIDEQAEHGDGNRLVEADRNGPDKPRKRLVTDKKRDHGEDDGAGEAGQIAELASNCRAQGDSLFAASCIGIGKGSQQWREEDIRTLELGVVELW